MVIPHKSTVLQSGIFYKGVSMRQSRYTNSLIMVILKRAKYMAKKMVAQGEPRLRP